MPGSGDVKVGLGDGFRSIDLIDEVGTFVIGVLVFVDWAIETDAISGFIEFGGFGLDDVEGAPGELG